MQNFVHISSPHAINCGAFYIELTLAQITQDKSTDCIYLIISSYSLDVAQLSLAFVSSIHRQLVSQFSDVVQSYPSVVHINRSAGVSVVEISKQWVVCLHKMNIFYFQTLKVTKTVKQLFDYMFEAIYDGKVRGRLDEYTYILNMLIPLKEIQYRVIRVTTQTYMYILKLNAPKRVPDIVSQDFRFHNRISMVHNIYNSFER